MRTIAAKYYGHCAGCGGVFVIGDLITNKGTKWLHDNCIDDEYRTGRAVGNLHIAESKVFGNEVSNLLKNLDEHNNYWKNGID